ncbi:MAG: transcriptional regulator [Bacteroidetes bacterium]|jgi:DNA-binding MarR family transcriptional regulator|nr:transcriptional regulator [Bacteroidota bacterium]MDF2452914.1 transcriptional regulator [Bacteroidota bacterium]
MTRKELFEYIQKVDDPIKDYNKIISNLHYTHYFLMDSYKKVLETYDLTFAQSNVLGIIVFKYPKAASLEEIKEMVLEHGSDVSRTVVRLTEKGFIEKVTDSENKRKLAIKATPKGLKTVEKMSKDPAFNKITTTFKLPEAKSFVKFLKKLREV